MTNPNQNVDRIEHGSSYNHSANNATLKVNAHIHLPPNFSAFDTVDLAVKLAAIQSVSVLGASNYYDYTVYHAFEAQCTENDIAPIFGTEIICMIEDLRTAGVKINDPGNPGKMYLCGKGLSRYDPMTKTAADLMSTIRRNDSSRMAAMIGNMCEQFEKAGLDTALTENDVKAMVVERHGSPESSVYLQERHIAQAFQERLFYAVSGKERADALALVLGCPPGCSVDDSVGIQNEIRSCLMKAGKLAFVPETFVGFEHAYGLILALGGIPCYPTLADGASPICGYEENVGELISATLARNIHCCELIPVRNSPEQVVRYVTAMRAAGLIVTAGTEHNTRDVIPMTPTCLDGEPIPEEIERIFWEGACVVTAHQHLTSAGKPGYVDETGNLAGDYRSTDDRIRVLKDLGSEIIHKVAGTVPNP